MDIDQQINKIVNLAEIPQKDNEAEALLEKIKPMDSSVITDNLLLKRLATAFNTDPQTITNEGKLLSNYINSLNLNPRENYLLQQAFDTVADPGMSHPNLQEFKAFKDEDKGHTVGEIRKFIEEPLEGNVYQLDYYKDLEQGSDFRKIIEKMFS